VDAGVTVEETIRVRAEGAKIKLGIYRDFPSRYKDYKGNSYAVGFQVLEVRKNNAPGLFHIAGLSNGQRVYIRNKIIVLAAGETVGIILPGIMVLPGDLLQQATLPTPSAVPLQMLLLQLRPLPDQVQAAAMEAAGGSR
jgi:hypothetical protein